jgi:predicted lipid-binding transport protein (Tim44 family)
MRKALAVFAVVLSLGMTMALDAEAARRLGGGKSSGMQRQNVEAPAAPRAAPGTPGQAAPAAGTAAAAAGTTAAAAGKRSWMGPIAGLAAGLGLMALASHFGFGEALANMMMMGLLAVGVMVAVGYFMRKRAAGQRPAMAGVGSANGSTYRQQTQDVSFRSAEPAAPSQGGSLIGSRIGAGLDSAGATGATGTIPADFDKASFERNAKTQFLGLQSANDAHDLDRLREYLTPEMFDLVRAELAERGNAPQDTQVFGLEAQVLDVAEEANGYVVSVRFTGSVRDEPGAPTDTLDEIWHLSKPRTGGGWLVAGIQQRDGSQGA